VLGVAIFVSGCVAIVGGDSEESTQATTDSAPASEPVEKPEPTPVPEPKTKFLYGSEIEFVSGLRD
jgi:hypothetical protein